MASSRLAETATTNGHQTDHATAQRDGSRPIALAGRVLREVSQQLGRRIPRANLDERDPDYIRERLPLLWLFASLWYRGEVRGLGNIPDSGPVLLVGNHSGGNMLPDTLVFTVAFSTYFGVERPFYQLAHNLVLTMPGLAWLRKFGTVAASQDNARKALRSDAALLVYPGGDYEVHRPIWERNRVDFNGRRRFLRLAIEEDVPIVPVVAIGGQETALFLSRGERLAQLLALDRIFRLKVLPISLALPPWGLNVGDMLGHIPLPAKITIETLPPIYLRERFGPQPDLGLEFMSGATRWEVASPNPTGLGARYRVLFRIGSAEIGGLIEVVEWAPACDLAWTSVTGLDQRGRWRLRETGRGGTWVELRLAYGVAGAGLTGWIAEHVAKPAVAGHLRRSLRQLKRVVEYKQLRGGAATQRSP